MFDRFTRLFLRFSPLLLLLAALLLRAGTASASTMIAGGNLGNQNWTVAGSPYILTGDSTIQIGATLTIQPGVTVEVVTGDVQASGVSTTRVELTIQGTLNAIGTAASPITFKNQSATSAGWYGIVIDPTATATINYAVLQDATIGVTSSAAGTQFAMSNSTFSNGTYGLNIKAGTPVLDNLTITGGNTGILYTGSGGGTVSNTVISGASLYGINTNGLTASSTVNVTNTVVKSVGSAGIYALAPSTGTLTMPITGSTIHANAGYGVYQYAQFSGTQTTVTIKNSIITQNTSYGVYRNTNGSGAISTTTTYSDVWGNPTNFQGSAAGAGCISINPIYVNAPSNLRLTSNSPARFAGETGLDLGPLPTSTTRRRASMARSGRARRWGSPDPPIRSPGISPSGWAPRSRSIRGSLSSSPLPISWEQALTPPGVSCSSPVRSRPRARPASLSP